MTPDDGQRNCPKQIPLASSQQNLYDIQLLLCVQCWTPDDGQRNCQKHLKFYSKINLRNSASRWFYYRKVLWCRVLRQTGRSGMTSWHHPGFFFVFGCKGPGVGHEVSGDHPSRGRVKVDISLYKSMTPVQIYVLYQFSMQDFPIISHSKLGSNI